MIKIDQVISQRQTFPSQKRINMETQFLDPNNRDNRGFYNRTKCKNKKKRERKEQLGTERKNDMRKNKQNISQRQTLCRKEGKKHESSLLDPGNQDNRE